MVKLAKRTKAIQESYDSEKEFSLEEAISLIKSNATSKFDETIDIAMNLGVDPRHADQMVRGTVSLPSGTGKTVRVAVFVKGDKAKEAKDAGADLVGDDDLVEEVKKGNIDFDRCIATPDMMAKMGPLGRILGPRGIMPNPKLGTVTNDVAKAVEAVKGGQVEFKVEKAGIVHAGIGKASFAEKAITENVKAFVKAVVQAKPSGAKGVYIKRVVVSSTMGGGIKLDVAALLSEVA